MNDEWFGARMTGPLGGTCSALMPRARKKSTVDRGRTRTIS